MSKLYIYRCKDDRATIYYSKYYPESLGIHVTEYEGGIPEGSGILKFNGTSFYYESLEEPDIPEEIADGELTTGEMAVAIMEGVCDI